MKTARIVRVATHPKHGTFGIFILDGQPICNTLEPYKRDNAKSVSCVPTGQYVMEVQESPKYGLVYTITNVQSRSYIRVHAGNLSEHTQGCLILGEQLGELKGKWAVLSSGEALREFRDKAKNEEILLTITEAF